jgi:hypothetical protein
MKKFGFLFFVLMLALIAIPSAGTRAADDTITVQLNAQNGSGEDGTATIQAVGANDIKVTINLKNGTAAPQPAHIHTGTCANLDPTPKYPLTNVVNGTSETTLMIGMADLETGHFAINVHKSAAEVATYVSCGDIMAMSMGGSSGTMSGGSTMPATGNGDQPLALVGLALLALTLMGAGLRLARNRA